MSTFDAIVQDLRLAARTLRAAVGGVIGLVGASRRGGSQRDKPRASSRRRRSGPTRR